MKNKKALVTGGTRGIGFETARELRAAGVEVTVTGTRPRGTGPEGCRYLAVDFSREAATERFAQQVARMGLSILVNNAGVNTVGPLESYCPEEFERIQRINLRAPFLLCQAVVPGMRRHRFGRIVNVASILSVVSRAGRSAYSASKGALVGLTRTLAIEVARDNVLVNCISPGFVDTDLTRRILGSAGLKRMAAQVPMGRPASPKEIARCIRFLVSDENSYLTGQNIIVDGGFTCG
ncbi:MAG: SDR family oxidoreductase [Candidatus Omnitrophica bacterium]|nr:SDR family oxidoreductase [Candidatus Omnitrophota bacterium]